MIKQSTAIFLLLLSALFSQAQTPIDYSQPTNWHVHPDKLINLLSVYNLDIAIIDKQLNEDSIISVPNNATLNTGVDVFFVHPTALDAFPPFPDTISLADQQELIIAGTIIGQAGLLAKYGRFFAPKYRQSSPSAFINSFYTDEERASSLLITYGDIRDAFQHYLDNFNGGNKIILAGHSQGAYLLGMLLRDFFDNDPILRAQLVTAALGGIGYVYGEPGNYKGGWWESIPLCTQQNQCQCIHNWASFKESQTLPDPNTAIPPFNQVLADSGLVYKNIDLSTDWFVHDSLFYGSTATPMRNYIAIDNEDTLSVSTNFVAFDSLYTARIKRTDRTTAVLSIDYTSDPLDLRPNELVAEESHPNYDWWGFHTKDYNLYIWPLLQQIDAKLAGCAITSITAHEPPVPASFKIYPNPTSGNFTLEFTDRRTSLTQEPVVITDLMGSVVLQFESYEKSNEISLTTPGIYLLRVGSETSKIIVVE